MRTTKKNFTAILLGALVLFTVCGCTATPSKSDALEELVIGGTMHEPYFYTDENGEFDGIDVRIAKEACKRAGYRATFKLIDWVKKNEYLQRGEIDCVWTCLSMNGRETEYLWAGPYASDRASIAVLQSSDIYSFSDLAGKTVAVQATSRAEAILLSNENKNVPPLKNVFSLYDIGESAAALRRGYVDACVAHEAALQHVLNDLEVEYRILDEPLLIARLGVAFLKTEDNVACAKINAALEEMRKDGLIRSAFASFGARLIER